MRDLRGKVKWRAAFLAAVLAAGMLEGSILPVAAQSPEAGNAETEAAVTGTVYTEEEPTEQEVLLEGYLYQQGAEDPENGIVLYGAEGSSRLTGDEKLIYDVLKAHVQEIAAGEKKSTAVVVEGFQSLRQTEVTGAMSKVMQYLLMDCPYDLYWHDKSDISDGGCRYIYDYGADGKVISLTASLTVAKEYRTPLEYPHEIDTSKTGAAHEAAENAREIVKANQGKSDYEKLKSYLTAINRLVSYNDGAGNAGSPAKYGNCYPWQIVWVFDKDSSTNVVCEGYAKAFQYLCDLSTFQNAQCYTVTGTMSGGQGAGAHMWNVVRLNGESYLVDVTNCDTGTVGAPDRLFLASASRGSVNGGYEFDLPGGTVSYQYGARTILNGRPTAELLDGVLDLATEPYAVEAKEELASVTAPRVKAVTFGDEVSRERLAYGTARDKDGGSVSGSFWWSDSVTSYGDAGTKQLAARFLPDDSKYNSAELLITVTVNRKPVKVTADAKSKAQGQPDPELTYQTEGLVEGYPLQGALGRRDGEEVGTYDIIQGTLTNENNPNYDISFQKAVLEISLKDYTVNVQSRQSIRPGTGEFMEPVFTDETGAPVEGTLTYRYRNKDYASYDQLKEELTKLVEGQSGEISFAFQPADQQNYRPKEGTITFSVRAIEFLAGGRPAAAGNGVTVKKDAVYGDLWSEIVKISGITARTDSQTDNNKEHFTLRQSGRPQAGSGQAFQVLYSGTLGGTVYTDEVVCEGLVDVKKRTITVTAGDCRIRKVYDKTRSPGTAEGEFAFKNIVSGDEDTLQIKAVPDSYGDPNVNAKNNVKTVISLEGPGARNYELGKTALEVPGEITPKPVTPVVVVSGTYSYTGNAVTPSLTVAAGGDVLAKTDYEMVVTNNQKAGTASVAVKPKAQGNYTWDPAVQSSFNIEKGTYGGNKNIAMSAKVGEDGKFQLSSALPAGYKLGTIQVEDKDQIFAGTPTLSGSTVSGKIAGDTGKIGKTATIVVPVTESSDYRPFNITLTVTVQAENQNSGSDNNNGSNSNNNNNNNSNNNNNNTSTSGNAGTTVNTGAGTRTASGNGGSPATGDTSHILVYLLLLLLSAGALGGLWIGGCRRKFL